MWWECGSLPTSINGVQVVVHWAHAAAKHMYTWPHMPGESLVLPDNPSVIKEVVRRGLNGIGIVISAVSLHDLFPVFQYAYQSSQDDHQKTQTHYYIRFCNL